MSTFQMIITVSIALPVVAVVGEAKLLGGLEGIGSTCQTNKNIIIIWPNKLYRGHSAVDILNIMYSCNQITNT